MRGKESGQGSQMSSCRALSLLITALSCTCLSCTCTESPRAGISTKRARVWKCFSSTSACGWTVDADWLKAHKITSLDMDRGGQKRRGEGMRSLDLCHELVSPLEHCWRCRWWHLLCPRQKTGWWTGGRQGVRRRGGAGSGTGRGSRNMERRPRCGGSK